MAVLYGAVVLLGAFAIMSVIASAAEPVTRAGDSYLGDQLGLAGEGVPQRGVGPVRGEQFVVRAALGDAALVQDHDPVGAGRGGQPVRDHDRGARRGQLADRVVDRGLGGQVERGGGLVEQQDGRVGQLGAGQRDELALAGRQVAAAFGDLVVVAAGQPGDHVVRAGRPGRRLDLGVAGVRPGVRDRVPDRAGEQVRLLRDDAELVPVAGQVVVADVGAVDQDLPAGRVVEPGDELDQRGLARAGLADQGDGLARLDGEADPVQRVVVASLAVAEVHVAQLDPAAQAAGPDRPRRRAAWRCRAAAGR